MKERKKIRETEKSEERKKREGSGRQGEKKRDKRKNSEEMKTRQRCGVTLTTLCNTTASLSMYPSLSADMVS